MQNRFKNVPGPRGLHFHPFSAQTEPRRPISGQIFQIFDFLKPGNCAPAGCLRRTPHRKLTFLKPGCDAPAGCLRRTPHRKLTFFLKPGFDLIFWISDDFDKSKKMRNVRTIIFHPFSRRDLCHVSENKGFRFVKNTLFHLKTWE